MFECDDVSFSRHDALDELSSSSIEEFPFERLEIFPEALEHLHRLIEEALDDLIEEKCWGDMLTTLETSLIGGVDPLHRRGLVVAKGDQIILRDEDIEFIVNIALSIGLIFGKMQNEKQIVIIRIDTSVLILLEDSFLIEFMESILFDDDIDIVERWIDIVLPDSYLFLGEETGVGVFRGCWCLSRSHESIISIILAMVPRAGIEPASREAEDFETSVSTNSTIWAFQVISNQLSVISDQ